MTYLQGAVTLQEVLESHPILNSIVDEIYNDITEEKSNDFFNKSTQAKIKELRAKGK